MTYCDTANTLRSFMFRVKAFVPDMNVPVVVSRTRTEKAALKAAARYSSAIVEDISGKVLHVIH